MMMRWSRPFSRPTGGSRGARLRLHVEPLEDRFLPSTVTNLNDSGPGSLRDAIATTPAGGLVDFMPGLAGTITLTTGPLNIANDLTVAGPGTSLLTVSGGGTSTVLGVSSGALAVTVQDLTIADGAAPYQGGGVLNYGTLSLTDVAVQDSTAPGGGGGIYNGGRLTLLDSLVENNTAGTPSASGRGGGILNSGLLTIVDSAVVSNHTLSGGHGGGIFSLNSLSLTNTLVAANVASGAGGGIANQGQLTLFNCTVADNQANLGGGLGVTPGGSPVHLTNTIVAGNTANGGPDIAGATASSTYNLVGNGTGASGLTDGLDGNQVGTAANPIDPLLGVMQTNGGPTPSLALLPGSPATDAGTNSGVPATDQRGFRRVVNGVADIGAYEYQPPATTTTLTSNSNPSDFNQAVTFTAQVAGDAPGSNTPTGTLTFSDGGNPLGSVPLVNGVATFQTSALAPGSHSIAASYDGVTVGDYAFDPSSSGPLAQLVRAQSLTTLTVTPGSSGVNDPVTLTAAVTGPGPQPTGSVTFFDGAVAVGTVSLSGGTATLVTAALPAGVHSLTASYGGDVIFKPSVSAPGGLNVSAGATAAQLTNDPPVASVNQAVTLTATVAPVTPGPLAPGGTVTFYDGVTVLGSAPLSGTHAVLVVSALGAGTHALSAQFGGDSNFLPSTSAPVNQGVTKGTISTLLTGSTNPSIVDQPVVFTATINPSLSGPLAPGGTVSFYDGSALLGTVALGGGQAVWKTTALKVGAHEISAAYSGDGNFEGGSTASLGHSVRPVTFFGVGGAPGRVRFYRPDNSLAADFQPYGSAYTDAVAVATGDVNGDGYYDLVTAATAGNPHVKVYDGKAFATGAFDAANPDASLLAQWFPYALQFNVGANVAVGDVNGDGFADVVTGATAGNPHTKVYSGKDIAQGIFQPDGASVLASFFPYALQFNVGAYVAAGDIDGDGRAEVVTGASVGNPHVKVYSGKAIADGTFDNANPDASLKAQWFAYELQFNVGATVAVGDTNGDGTPDVITGATAGNPHVKVFDGAAVATQGPKAPPAVLDQFFAYGLNFNVGARVAAADFDGDGKAEILTGASVGSPHYRAVKGDASGNVPPALFEGIPDDLSGGIYVGA
jgi:hypothetical protein